MVGNIINEVLFGYRNKYDDCEKLMNYVEDFQNVRFFCFLIPEYVTQWMIEIAKAPEIAIGFVAPSLLKVSFFISHTLKSENEENSSSILTHIFP